MSASDVTASTGGAPGRPDLRPVWLAAAAWAGAWLATTGEPRLWALGVAAACALALAGRRRRLALLTAVGVVLMATVGVGAVRVVQQRTSPLADLAREGAVVSAELRLVGASRWFDASGTRPAMWRGRSALVAVEGRGGRWASGGAPVEVSATGEAAAAWAALPLGTTVRAGVRLSSPEPQEGLEALARAREPPVVVSGPGPVEAAVAAVREGLRRACDPLGAEPRALVPALVVGDTAGMPDDLVERFRVTGLTHLTAVSGANLTLLLVFLRLAAVWCGLRGRWLTAALSVGVVGFVVLCLGEPSVVRAAAMGLVGLAAVGSAGRGRHGLRYLAAAVLGLVLIDPWLGRSIGFALSVLASGGLLWWAGRWTDALARWLPRWAGEAIAVPLAAQLATQPLVTAISGQVSVAGLLANAAAGPLVGPATVCGFVAAGLSVVWLPGATAFAWLAGWCAQGLCWIARLGEALPGAATPWPTSWQAIVLVGVLCWCVALVMPRLLAQRWLTLAVSAGMVAALARTPTPPGWPPADWAVVSCDVGQGDATLLNAGAGQAVLVDTGPDPALLRRCLDQLGVRELPLVVLTHLHADHAGGLPAAMARRTRYVVSSRVAGPSYGAALLAQAAAGSSHWVAGSGEAWQVGQVRLEVLAAPPAAAYDPAGEGESSAENDASLLLRATVGGLSVLLAGDAEETGQDRLLGLGPALDVDVILVPHHGSSRQSAAFLALTTPTLALVSVGARNDYGHPTAKTLRLVQGLGATIVRTDLSGSIALRRAPPPPLVARPGEASLTVTTQR